MVIRCRKVRGRVRYQIYVHEYDSSAICARIEEWLPYFSFEFLGIGADKLDSLHLKGIYNSKVRSIPTCREFYQLFNGVCRTSKYVRSHKKQNCTENNVSAPGSNCIVRPTGRTRYQLRYGSPGCTLRQISPNGVFRGSISSKSSGVYVYEKQFFRKFFPITVFSYALQSF